MHEDTSSLRARCPEFAAFIDELRRVFGRAEIDAQIRRGMNGEPSFHVVVDDACGRLELGTPKPTPRMVLDARAYIAWGRKIAEIEAAAGGAAELSNHARDRAGCAR